MKKQSSFASQDTRRWIIGGLIIGGGLTMGMKRITPLVDEIRHDPVVGIIVVLILALLTLVIVHIIQD
ncbi:MAG: hypothetical protein DA408_01865 [Bacteroidetes bacterium]|nr:MAG: hypothetical protein C7N36_02710 [Bacteroidota bacterium]PTM14787.1 MAG: hypothetical protein DA408_01865 [Bacteroidota bacterium]